MKMFHHAVTTGLSLAALSLAASSLVACSADNAPPSPPIVAGAPAAVTHDTTTTPPAANATTPGAKADSAPLPTADVNADGSKGDDADVPADGPKDDAPDASGKCVGLLNGGKNGSFSTDGISLDGCTDECNTNAAGNLGTQITCTWNGAPVAITSVGMCVGLLNGGKNGSFSTDGISLDGCLEECKTNADGNPQTQITCTWNGQPIPL